MNELLYSTLFMKPIKFLVHTFSPENILCSMKNREIRLNSETLPYIGQIDGHALLLFYIDLESSVIGMDSLL